MPKSIPTVSLPVAMGRLHHVPNHLVLCNQVVLPEEPSDCSLWVIWQGIGYAKKYLGAAWGSFDHDALAALEQSGLVEQSDIALNVTIKRVDFVPSRDWKILCLFAESRGAEAKTLADLR